MTLDDIRTLQLVISEDIWEILQAIFFAELLRRNASAEICFNHAMTFSN